MAMKPSLVLKLGQQLKMTPQLQQAIKLLQLSSLELDLEIQEALDSNLMLEELDQEESTDEPTSLDEPEEPIDDPTKVDKQSDTESTDEQASADNDEQVEVLDPEIDGDLVPDSHQEMVSESIGEDLPVDSLWEDVWDESYSTSPAGSAPAYDDENYLDTRNSEDLTLQDHLLDQVNLLHISDKDRLIAVAIIDSLGIDGVLTGSLEDILSGFAADLEIELDEVEAVLHLIQHLDPVGVASRNLRECLLIQLNQLPDDVRWRKAAVNLVSGYLSYLGHRDFTQLIRKTKLKEQELKEVITLIQSLNPRPGAEIAATKIEIVNPDVIVTKQKGRWQVELNPKTAPRIRVNSGYAAMVKRADNSDDNTYLRNNLQEARWFIKSLQQRNDTLLKVATKIVEYQRGFLEYGDEAMKPLVLHDIAEAVNLHESTVSRVTTHKYMITPGGMYELKYFFSSHVGTHGGGEVSSTAIRALIKRLVAQENPKKPLSDSKIASLLGNQDIKVARRTIAKYRESLMIPPSNERKRLT
jgi:RNA polymerase sigma-54 factor